MSVLTGTTAANAKTTPMLRNMFATIFLFINYPSFPLVREILRHVAEQRASLHASFAWGRSGGAEPIHNASFLLAKPRSRKRVAWVTCGGLDGRGFGVDGIVRWSLFASQEKMNVVRCGRTCDSA